MLETLRKFISLIQSFSLFDHDVCWSGCFQWPLLFGWIEIEFALTRGYQLTRKGRFIVLVLLTPLFCFRNKSFFSASESWYLFLCGQLICLFTVKTGLNL